MTDPILAHSNRIDFLTIQWTTTLYLPTRSQSQPGSAPDVIYEFVSFLGSFPIIGFCLEFSLLPLY